MKLAVVCALVATGIMTALTAPADLSAADPVTAPGENVRTVTSDGAWCWFQDPRAVAYFGEKKRVYTGWVTAKGGGVVQVAAYDPDTDSFEYADLAKLHKDDHANPAIHILPDGRLMVFYSAHNGADMFYRISEKPEDISAWGSEHKVGVNTQGHGYTYPNPVRLSGENGKLYLFWRGGTRQPAFSTTDDNQSWSPVRELINAGKAPYLKVASDGDKTIHFAFSNDHPEYDSDNNIYYMRYEDGLLRRADGSLIKSLDGGPVTPEEADLVYDSASGDGRAWIWDVASDKDGMPVIVFTVSARPPENTGRFPKVNEKGWNHHYRYARWDGEKWQVHPVVSGGSWFPETKPGKQEQDPYYAGGVVIDHNDPSTLYLSREIGDTFEIERWHTNDRGASWKSTPVTTNSKALNVRPVVPRGPRVKNASVLWMHGNYVGYVDYSTAIQMGDALESDTDETTIGQTVRRDDAERK